jgi:hypothetical protein
MALPSPKKQACPLKSDGLKIGCYMAPSLIDRRQLLRFGRARYSSLLNRLGSRSRIDSIEDGGTHKDGEKEGDYIHAYTKEQRLPATDCIEG